MTAAFVASIFSASMQVSAVRAETLSSSEVELSAKERVNKPEDQASEAIRRTFSPRALKAFFGEEAARIDFAKLQEESEVGQRQFDLYVDGRFVIRQNVELFHRSNGRIGIRLPATLILSRDLKFADLPRLSGLRPTDMIDDVPALIPGAMVAFDAVKARADVSIPRSWYASFARFDGFLPPPRWTYGIPAVILNYQANAQWHRYGETVGRHGYLSFDARANFRQWRLFGSGSVSVDKEARRSRTQFERGDVNLTRVFGEKKVRIKAGELHTQAFYLDSLPLLGIEIYDDDSMMSSAERGYAPVVSGIAQSAARVTVRQFGRIVFERNVEPGPFRFADLPGLTSGTDLVVTIHESDGSERTFVVPYMEAPLMLRAGRTHFHVGLGRLHENGQSMDGGDPFVFSGGIGYGLPYDLSIFGGTQMSRNYWNATSGIAANLGVPGAISIQLDRAQYEVRRQAHYRAPSSSGLRLREQWLKHFSSTGAFVSASWRRYLAGRYLSLVDYRRRYGRVHGAVWDSSADLQDEVTLALTQSLGHYGNWQLSGTYYRFASAQERSNVGSTFSTAWQGISLSLSLQHTQSAHGSGEDDRETVCFANITVPLSMFFGYSASAQYATVGLQRDADGRIQSTMGSSGAFGKDRLWSYALTASRGNGAQSLNGSLSREGANGRATLSGAYGDHTARLALSGEGSLIGTAYGVLPAKRVVGGSAIIEVPGAPEAKPETFTAAARLGDRFFITDLNNYQANDITIDPNSIPANVMMPIYLQRLVPADDAVLAIKYETMKGWQFAPQMTRTDGARLPFGAHARIVAHGLLSGMDTVLNERSRAYFSAAPMTGVVEVVWRGKRGRRACWAPYSLKKDIDADPNIRVIQKTLVCREVPDPVEPLKP